MFPKSSMIALSLLMANGAIAADSEGRFAVKGAGISSCEKYLAEFDARSKAFYAYGGWVEGYLTATNQYLDATYDVTPWETTTLLATLLAEHCRKAPDKPFIRAVRAMVTALSDERIQESSPLLIAKSGDSGVRVYREVIRRMQRRLAELELYEGEIDGVYNNDTRSAITAYQEREGIEPNGLPDQNTLTRLMR
jgi:hypothetical protein